MTEKFAHCLNLQFQFGDPGVSPFARFLSTGFGENTCTIILQTALTDGRRARHARQTSHLFIVTIARGEILLIPTFDWRQGSQALFSGA